MPIDLKIKQIKFPSFPKGIGQRGALEEFKKQLPDILKKINEDLLLIVDNGLKAPELTDPIKEILDPLKDFFQKVQDLPDSEIKTLLQQQVRIFILILNNRLEHITAKEQKESFTTLLTKINMTIGVVPELNEKIELPSSTYLPQKFSESKGKWEKMVYKSPGRDSKSEPVDFFIRKEDNVQISSVRRQLIAIDANPKNKNEALSYAHADFYEVGDLQADHIQPSDQIIQRQQEMLQAMSIDPIFCHS